MTERDTPVTIRREVTTIPAWAFAIAAVLFVLIPFLFYTFVWSRGGSDAPQPFRILVSFLPGTILAFLALMAGYVNKDAGRRGMNRTLWTLIVIFVPNAIGFILYFLMRHPVRVECPKCAAATDLRANFCPNCGYSFSPACPQCRSAVRPGDKFCAHCG